MQALTLTALAVAFAMAAGCSSAGGAVLDAGGHADGGMTCSPACGAGAVCVGTGTLGGAVIVPDDAGVCPSGTHNAGTTCENDLGYACMPIPGACTGGAVTCTCASTLCQAGHMCQVRGDGVLTCVELVP